MSRQTWVLAMLVAVVALSFGGGAAWAQGDTTIPFNKAVISDPMAKRTSMKGVINAETARALVDACIEFAKAHPAMITIDVVVLSPSGQVVDQHAMDGLMPIGQEATMMKAKTVLFTRQPTAVLEQRYMKPEALGEKISRADFAKDQGLAYFDVAGGFPIVVDNQMIGVIAAGGGSAGGGTDSQCAYQALQKVIGPQPPLLVPGIH